MTPIKLKVYYFLIYFLYTIYGVGWPNFYTFLERPENGYSCLEFSETSLLVALGDMPHFKIFIYNWRNGEKFAEHESGIVLEQQMLR